MTLCWNGQYLKTYSIEAPDIADLSLQSSSKASLQGYSANQSRNVNSAPAKSPAQQPFVDPAILSFSKPPMKPADDPPELRGPQHWHNHIGGPISEPVSSSYQAQREPRVAASLSEPFSSLEPNVHNPTAFEQKEMDASVLEGMQNVGISQAPMKFGGKKSQRIGRNKQQRKNLNELSPVNEHDGAANTNPKTKGWRQTAFVQPAHPHMNQSPQSYKDSTVRHNQRRRKRQNQGGYAEENNGWATEDATDIQEMGEFDFQGNLSKFDKRRVFEEIRNDDTTADEARLVSFNKKVPKPGTNGGKNLHWSENVLDDSPQNSETSGTDEDVSDERPSSANYSGRDRSRASTRPQNSRKGSAILGQPSMGSQFNTIGRGQLSSRTTSPRPGKTPSPISGPSVSSASLRLTTTNRSCPTVSPLQTIEVEQIAVAELGLTEDMITENAGRGIAEAAVGLLSNDAAAPTMLVLTGNHRTGARAIAAARHLRNRGHRVTVCMLGLEHHNELLESCRKQLGVFRKVGGRVTPWEELTARLSTSEFAPDLVVDALFGIHLSFDDLRTDDQATAFEMISWVNRSNIDTLSVDVPSGLSASSGKDHLSFLHCTVLLIIF